MKKAVVIGAGISGLLSGLVLVKEGYSVTILESMDKVGGMCRSYNVNGYSVDTGPHIITRLQNGPLRKLMDKYFDVTPEFIPHGEYYIRSKGKICPFPWTLRAFAFFEHIPKKDRIMVLQNLLSLYSQRIFNPDFDNISVWDIVKNKSYSDRTLRFIDTLCKFLTGNGMEKTPVSRFMDSQDYKNKNEKESQDPIDYLNNLKNIITKKGAEDQCYPIGGLQSIIESILKSMPKDNITIKCGCPAEKINTNDKGVTGVVTKDGTIPADIIIYSSYSSELPNLVDNLPEAYKNDLQKLEKVMSLTLWLGLDKTYFDKIGSEIWMDSTPSCWVVPVSNYDGSLAPEGHQLVGFATNLPEKYNEDDEKSKLMAAIEKELPGIKDHITMEHYQIVVPEKAAWVVHQKMPSCKTLIKGLYLVGTDTTHKSMGITRASYSVLNLLEAIKK
ncbi:MAG: phytoene desaturase family protein [Candidatus Methanofastidiosia archaeon]